MAPGIEPGNLIRSTLIRYPPGPFNLANGVENIAIGYMRDIENIAMYHLCFSGLLTATTGIETKAEPTRKVGTTK